MLPFKLVEVDEPILHLHIGDVEVETEFFVSEFVGTNSHQEVLDYPGLDRMVLRRVREAAYRAFTVFLKEFSEPAPFLPVEQLSQYPNYRFSLLVSVPRWYELHEIFLNAPDSHRLEHGNMVFEYNGYEIELRAKHFITDTSAFLVSSEKYTLFIRSIQDTEITRYKRSQFTDLSEYTPPSFHINAQELSETILHNLVNRDSALSIEQLLMFPSLDDTESESDENLTCCPECKGEVRRIDKNYFCLECDWDDLPILKRFAKSK